MIPEKKHHAPVSRPRSGGHPTEICHWSGGECRVLFFSVFFSSHATFLISRRKSTKPIHNDTTQSHRQSITSHVDTHTQLYTQTHTPVYLHTHTHWLPFFVDMTRKAALN